MEQQTTHHLSEDIIIQEILPRLPAKSLCRFKCVSKKWYQVISDDPSFSENQSRKFSAFSGILFDKYNGILSRTSEIGFTSHDEKLFGIPDPSLGFLRDRIKIVASCKGLVCCRSVIHPRRYYICNPVTREWRSLPESSCDHGLVPDVALSFNPFVVPPNYKLVVFTSGFSNGLEADVEIFDSKTYAWRVATLTDIEESGIGFQGRPYQSIGNFCSIVRGIIYWFRNPFTIMSYDSDKDSCSSLSLPALVPDEGNNMGWVGELDGCLSYANWEKDKGDVKVWSFKSHPSSNEWLLRYHIKLDTVVKYEPGLHQLWILSSVDGELLFVRGAQRELYVYYFKTGRSDLLCSSPWNVCDIYPYTNSMARVPWN